MKTNTSRVRLVNALLTGALCVAPIAVFAHGEKLTGAAKAEVEAFAGLLGLNPNTAIDLTAKSGEYCMNADIMNGGHMTHYAADPQSTREDVIDFVNAQSFVDAGINVDKLPLFPGEMGKMEPNQWYFMPAGAHDPHHGMKWPVPMMIRASNIE